MRTAAWRRRLWWAVLAAIVACAGLVAWVRLGPLPAELLSPVAAVSTVVVDRDGSVLYEARTGAGTRRARLDPDALPPALVAATLAAEDRRFFGHPGIDPLALARALFRNARTGAMREGGSTITQQTAKLLIAAHAGGARRRDLWSKLREAVIALRLEHRFRKPEILALYLDLAPYGNQVVGAARAAQIYFGVEASMLTPAQAAFLAGLPQRPSAFNPYRDRAAGLRRQREIIGRMARQGRLAAGEADLARREQLRFAPWPRDRRAPHFVEMVLAAQPAPLPRRLQTTLDAGLQSEVEGIVRSQRAALERHGAHNVAVVVLDNRTAEWLAWEGSGDYGDQVHGGAINGPMAPRQPGSALKPFTYALAFETGDTPATVLPDVPSTFPTAEPGVVYTPRNYDGRFHGPLRMRAALAGSQNVPAVALVARLGVPDLLQVMRQVGFTTLDKTAAYYGVGLTLGNAEVRLSDLVAAYSALARGGVYLQPRSVRASAPPVMRRVFSPRAAFWVTDVLSDPDARAYVFGRGGSLEFPFEVAAKTGTSQAYRDNWAIGYTRAVTVGVWVGNFDRRPLVGSSGVSGAGPLFHAVMLAAERRAGGGRGDAGTAIVERPGDLHDETVCELSGMRAGPACAVRRREWVPPGFPHAPCDWHHDSEHGVLTFWPAEYRPWARAHRLLPADPPRAAFLTSAGHVEGSARITARPSARPARVAIVSPPDGATYLIDPTLRAEFQTVTLRAVSAHGAVEWRVDGRPHVSTPADRDGEWRLRPGRHVITARDATGGAASSVIRVR